MDMKHTNCPNCGAVLPAYTGAGAHQCMYCSTVIPATTYKQVAVDGEDEYMDDTEEEIEEEEVAQKPDPAAQKTKSAIRALAIFSVLSMFMAGSALNHSNVMFGIWVAAFLGFGIGALVVYKRA